METISLGASVATALQAVDLEPKHHAAAQLALTYARAIDRTGDLAKLGPLLLHCLAALGMTPRAATTMLGTGTAPAVPTPNAGTGDANDSPLARLRAERNARRNPAN